MPTTFGQLQFGADVKMRTLDGTSAVTIGAQNRIALEAIAIPPAATPVTVTIAGFYKWDGTTLAAKTTTLTGPDSDAAAGGPITEQIYPFHGAVNEAGSLILTPSVDEVVRVYYREV